METSSGRVPDVSGLEGRRRAEKEFELGRILTREVKKYGK